VLVHGGGSPPSGPSTRSWFHPPRG